MKEYSLDELDMLMNDVACNLITTAKNETTIFLSHFGTKNKTHLAVFETAELLCSVTGFSSVAIDLPYWKFKWFRFCHKHKNLLRCRTCDGIDVSELASLLESARNMPGGLEQIYNIYYAKGKKK